MADSKGSGASNKKVANSVVALSSAAVLAVYAAGYVKTKAAAERLEAAAQRRPHLPMPAPTAAPGVPLAEHAAAGVTAAQVPAAGELRAGSGAGPAVAGAVDAPAVNAAPAASGSVPVASAAIEAPAAPASGSTQPAAAAVSEPVAVVAKVEPAPAPPVPAPVAISTLPMQQTERPVPPLSPPATTAPAAPVIAGWKDGKYLGWGYSRHGEIQAQVVIENGRIAYAVIAKCQTRWSCSLVEHLQKQVAQRQGPEVDYVAGATDSANAFYGAVVEALKQAR